MENLRAYQRNVWNTLKKQNNREILFINCNTFPGKSYLSKAIIDSFSTAYHTEMHQKCLRDYNLEQYVIFDLRPTSKINYSILCSLKDGFISDPSWRHSQHLSRFHPPKVLVFGKRPNTRALAPDRYQQMCNDEC